MSGWEIATSMTCPPFYKKEKNAYLVNENIKSTSNGYFYMYKRMSKAEFEEYLRNRDTLKPMEDNILKTMDSDDTTIMGAQADTYEQVLGIDDVMEALADIYTEILEIKERL